MSKLKHLQEKLALHREQQQRVAGEAQSLGGIIDAAKADIQEDKAKKENHVGKRDGSIKKSVISIVLAAVTFALAAIFSAFLIIPALALLGVGGYYSKDAYDEHKKVNKSKAKIKNNKTDVTKAREERKKAREEAITFESKIKELEDKIFNMKQSEMHEKYLTSGTAAIDDMKEEIGKALAAVENGTMEAKKAGDKIFSLMYTNSDCKPGLDGDAIAMAEFIKLHVGDVKDRISTAQEAKKEIGAKIDKITTVDLSMDESNVERAPIATRKSMNMNELIPNNSALMKKETSPVSANSKDLGRSNSPKPVSV